MPRNMGGGRPNVSKYKQGGKPKSGATRNKQEIKNRLTKARRKGTGKR